SSGRSTCSRCGAPPEALPRPSCGGTWTTPASPRRCRSGRSPARRAGPIAWISAGRIGTRESRSMASAPIRAPSSWSGIWPARTTCSPPASSSAGSPAARSAATRRRWLKRSAASSAFCEDPRGESPRGSSQRKRRYPSRMQVRPSRSEFERLAADHTVVPVSTTFVADRETPVSAFEKLAGTQPGFLLESVEGGENWGRWSFVGWDPAFSVTSREGSVAVDRPGLELRGDDPLSVLEDLVARHSVPAIDGLPPLHSGLVGYMAFDVVRDVEHLPDRPPDDRGLPEMVWHFVGSLAAFDRVDQTITLVRNVFVDEGGTYDDAVAALEEAVARLGAGSPYTPTPVGPAPEPPPWTSTFTREDFVAAVEEAKDRIRAGDAFQIVLSQRLATEAPDDCFDVYRALRLI